MTKDRAAEFQFGHNHMKMTPFEENLVQGEKDERRLAHDRYAVGIRGRDGGMCYDKHPDIDHFPPLKK